MRVASTSQMHTVVNKIRSILAWAIAIWGVLFLVVQILTFNIEPYKASLEAVVAEEAGVVIRIGALRSATRRGLPELILDRVEVVSADNPESFFTLKQVRLRVDLWHLIKTQSLLSASQVQLVGAEINVTRNRQGELQITGFEGQADSPVWLSQVGTVDVFESQLVFQDQGVGGQALRFKDIKLWLNNRQPLEHEIRMEFGWPRDLGHRATVAIQLQRRNFSLPTMTGRFYLKSDQLNVAKVAALTELLKGQALFLAGSGDVELWGDFKQMALTSLSGRVDLTQVNVFNSLQHQAFLKSFGSWFQWRRDAGVSYLDLRKITVGHGGRSRPLNNLSVSWSEDVHNGGYQIGLSLTKMPLSLLAKVSDFLKSLKLHPLPQFKKWALTGTIPALTGHYHTQSKAFTVDGRLNEFGFLPSESYPGISHLTGRFSGTDQAMMFHLDAKNVRYSDRNVFAKDLEIQSLTGAVALQSTVKGRVLSSDDLTVAMAPGVFHNRFQLLIPEVEAETLLSFQSQIKAVQAQNISPYLPVGILDADLAAWLQQAFFEGDLKQADFLFHGRIADYPFVKGNGILEALLEVRGLGFHYESQWPVFTGIDANILFLNDAMMGSADQWLLNNSAVLNSEFFIPSLLQSDHVWVKGEVVGKIEKTLAFLAASPLKSTLEPVVENLSLQGENHIFLDMKIPMVLSASAHVNGLARLTNASLAGSSANFVIQNIYGELGFSEQGLYTPGTAIQGEALGFPVSAAVENLPDQTRVLLNGYTDINHLDAFFPSPQWSYIKGGADYQLAIQFPNDPEVATQWLLSSDLMGLQEQISKNKVPLDADFSASVRVGEGSLYEGHVRYGSQLKAALRFDAQAQQVHGAHVVVGEGLPTMPTRPGWEVAVNKEQIDLDHWLGLVREGGDHHNVGWEQLNLLTVAADRLTYKGGELADIALTLEPKAGLLSGDFKAGHTQGAFQWPTKGGVDETIHLALKTFDIVEVNDFYQQFGRGSDSFKTLPRLQFTSEQFLWRGFDLGRLRLTTTTFPDRLAINKLSLISNDHALRLKGRWSFLENQTDLVGQFKGDDFGGLLTEMAITDELLGATAAIDFTLNWTGRPTSVALEKLNGYVRGVLGKGSLLGIEPGIGRLLGAFDLSEWRRRLELDFSDMFGKGLAFNQMSGSFNLFKGVGQTQDLTIDGVSAKIAVMGTVDLAHKNIRQVITLTPKSTALIPFAGTIAGNVVERITGSHPDELTQLQYFIEGPWAQPEVIRIYENDGLLQKFWTGITRFAEDVQ